MNFACWASGTWAVGSWVVGSWCPGAVVPTGGGYPRPLRRIRIEEPLDDDDVIIAWFTNEEM